MAQVVLASVRLCPVRGSKANSTRTPCCTCMAWTFTIVHVLPWVAFPSESGLWDTSSHSFSSSRNSSCFLLLLMLDYLTSAFLLPLSFYSKAGSSYINSLLLEMLRVSLSLPFWVLTDANAKTQVLSTVGRGAV